MKYMGSKARLAKDILPIILKNRSPGQWYVEPFAGGMNMMDKVDGNRLANDVHHELICMWDNLVNKYWFPTEINKEYYYDVRDNKSKYAPHIVGWVGFNCSYSGKYFGGFAGKTKTKLNTIRDYQLEAINNVKKQIKNLQGVIFSNKNYFELELPTNSIVYCDPPYEGTTEYTNKFDHNLFWGWVREMDNKGHTVYVSEYHAPQDFACVWNKEIKSSLSANGVSGGSKISVEKLFTIIK